MTTVEPTGRGGTVWDAPNQQVVGVGAPWEEGSGGAAELQPLPSQSSEDAPLDAMTKDELLAYAQQIGASPANASMTKDEIRSSIDEAEAA